MNFNIADSLSDFRCFFSAELYVLGCEVLFQILDRCRSALQLLSAVSHHTSHLDLRNRNYIFSLSQQPCQGQLC
jgi:hypothetical protein